MMRRRAVILVVGCVLATAAACVPPPTGGGTVPTCPLRRGVVVEQTDQTDYSLVRGVSANGDWLVTSRAVGADLELTLQHVGSSDPGVPVGTIEDFALYVAHSVAVSDDGQRVVFDPDPTGGPVQPVRWDRTTGATEPLTPPEPGSAIRRVAPDLTLLAWATTSDATAFTVTDALSDAVLGTSWTGLGESSYASRSGRFELADGLVDHADGSARPIDGMFESIPADWEIAPVESVSPSGDQVLLRGTREEEGITISNMFVWDVEQSTLRDLGTGHYTGGVVADDGRAVLFREPPVITGDDVIEEHAADGTVTIVHAGSPVRPLFDPDYWSPQNHFIATPDLHTVAFTAFTAPIPPTARVIAARCQ